jgi:hypothetical protein
MKKLWMVTTALLLAMIQVATPRAQTAEVPQTGLGRILAAARRASTPEPVLIPALSSLEKLEADGLPTERFVERMVECISKGASAERLRIRAEGAVEDTRAARILVDGMKARGLKDSPSGYEWSAVEDLADTLETGEVSSSDMEAVQKALRTDLLSRVLAGGEALAHLRAMKVGDKAGLMVLGAAPVSLADQEIRRIPSAFFVGRRCGMADADVLQALVRQVGAGALPSALMRQWAEEAGLRGPGRGQGWGRQQGGPGRGWGSPGAGSSGAGAGGSGAGRDGGPGGSGGDRGDGGAGGGKGGR